MISRTVKHFVFKLDDGFLFTYNPGQFVTLYFEHEGKVLNRSYSIANPPGVSPRIELAAGFVENGPGTLWLFNLKPGDIIQARGPFGRLVLKEQPPKRYVLISTSTGVTPYRAMLPLLRNLLEQYEQFEIVILQGVQTKADILYHDEFSTFARETPRVTYRAQLSREQPDSQSIYEASGRVQDAFPSLNLVPTNDIVYLCGNPNMVDESFAWLKDHAFPLQHIIREKYISR